jgi:hypothetical protein
MGIGGNLYALLQVKDDGEMNAINERVHTWSDCASLHGWLDLSTGDSKYTNNAKVQESTHIFLCDFTSLENLPTGIIKADGQETAVDVTSENARMVINGLVYEILLIDNPMNMNEHLEIYLKFTGGQNER